MQKLQQHSISIRDERDVVYVLADTLRDEKGGGDAGNIAAHMGLWVFQQEIISSTTLPRTSKYLDCRIIGYDHVVKNQCQHSTMKPSTVRKYVKPPAQLSQNRGDYAQLR